MIDNHRRVFPGQQDMVGSYFAASDVHFRAAKGRSITGRPPLVYARHQQLRLAIPDAAAGVASGRPRITILPAGSGEVERYPSIDSWAAILTALAERYPEGRLCDRTASRRGRDPHGRGAIWRRSPSGGRAHRRRLL